MSKHLQREMDTLSKKLLALATLAEEQVRSAVGAVERKDVAEAVRIIETDRIIDLQEIDVEEECLKLLALHQPVAADLRFTVAVLKINSDLERIADLAANIADKAIRLSNAEKVTYNENLTEMCELTIGMLRKARDSLFTSNAVLAREVCDEDVYVDELNRKMIDIVKLGIMQEAEHTSDYLILMSVSRSLERIADHATNIAEDVIYMIDGDIVRHLKA